MEWNRRRAIYLAMALASLPLSARSATPPTDNAKIPAVRWDETHPGCTFSHTDDGKLRYGLWWDDVGMTLSVDSQELEKVRRRHEPFIGVLLDVRYRGRKTVEVGAQDISLEFVKHFQVVQTSLDPDEFSDKIQANADALDHEIAVEIQKHPEKKQAKEAYVRAFQKDAAELLEFVSRNTLRPTQLNEGNPEVSGWVLFSTQSKWIGGWKNQEEFILRVPLDGKMFEFPFTLPPKPGEVMLRKR